MTVPGPRDIPTSRRAARQQRDEVVAPVGVLDPLDGGIPSLPQWWGDAAPLPSRHRSNFLAAEHPAGTVEQVEVEEVAVESVAVEQVVVKPAPHESELAEPARTAPTTTETVPPSAIDPLLLQLIAPKLRRSNRAAPVVVPAVDASDVSVARWGEPEPAAEAVPEARPTPEHERIFKPPPPPKPTPAPVPEPQLALRASPSLERDPKPGSEWDWLTQIRFDPESARTDDAAGADPLPEWARLSFAATPAPAAPPALSALPEIPSPADIPAPAPQAFTPQEAAQREDDLPARHARVPRASRIRTILGLAVAAVLILGGTSAVTAAVAGVTPGHGDSDATRAAAVASITVPVPLPAPAESIPAPEVTAVPAFVDICADPAFTSALGAGDDAGAIALAGGGESFRAVVAAGLAPCVSLADPTRLWVVVNKQRPFDPIDYDPWNLVYPSGVRNLPDTVLHPGAADALTTMVDAAWNAGVGELAISSGFRSYDTQRSVYGAQVDASGAAQAELGSARPGHSEHQSGLAVDLAACFDGSCGTLDDIAGTAQGAWLVEHAWEYGWIVRYEDGYTGVTGYSGEAWHLRYIGHELAAAYHNGGWHTLEEFFGLPAAPEYLD